MKQIKRIVTKKVEDNDNWSIYTMSHLTSLDEFIFFDEDKK